jgi:hypothetical protein
VRLNSLRQGQYDDEAKMGAPEVDIQAAIKILGERSYERCAYEMDSLFSLNLKNAALQRSNLNSLQFPFVDFDSADLRYATLQYTDFRQAWLGWVNFQFADFHKCCLHRAALRGADLRNTTVASDMLRSTHGVKAGYGRTLLPSGVEPPCHWFNALEVETDSEELREAYLADYRKFLDRDGESWFPGPGKQIQVKDIRPAV